MTNARTSGLGSGGLWLGAAKLWFLVAAYGLTIALTHLLSPEVYGRYYVVARLIAVPNMVIIYTVLFSVSRPLAAEFPYGFPSYDLIRARGLRLALGIGGPASLLVLLAAPAFARWLGDEAMATPIRVVAPISVVYALYAVNIGTLNAVRAFARQASLDISMATAKAGLMIAAAAAGMGLAATVGGFTAATFVVLILSTLMVRGLGSTASGEATGSRHSMATFAGLLIVFTGVVNLLQSADVLVLKAHATPATADAVGFYSSAEQVALVPYSLMNAVSLVAFPLVASIDVRAEPQKARAYLSGTIKVSLLILAFLSSVCSAASSEIQSLLFPRAYGAAASELRLLVWGFSGYSMAVTTAWILNSAKRSAAAIGVVSVPLLTVLVGTFVLTPTMFTMGAAIAVCIAGGIGMIVALLVLWRMYGAALPAVHIVKVLAAIAAVELVSAVWPTISTQGVAGKLLILVKLAALAVTFVAVAMGLRAVRLQELRELRRAR